MLAEMTSDIQNKIQKDSQRKVDRLQCRQHPGDSYIISLENANELQDFEVYNRQQKNRWNW